MLCAYRSTIGNVYALAYQPLLVINSFTHLTLTTMNNYIHYGITYLTGYAIIKLRCKLADYIAIQLAAAYPTMDIKQNRKGMTHIEGILPSEIYDNQFFADYKIAMLRSKAIILNDKIFTYRELKELILKTQATSIATL